MRLKLVLITALAAFAIPLWPSIAQDQAGRIAALMPSIESNLELRAVYEACPADIYRTKATLFSLLGTYDGPDADACASDLRFCHDSCVSGKNSDACFSLARILQEHGAPASDKHFEPLFALACAIGKPSGCTNRAAGMRNGDYLDEPARRWTEAKRGLCLRRSFKTSCDANEGWGCAMHGQALFLGEGGPDDWEAAAASFEKSCALDPDFDSCDFAKSYLSDMKALQAPQ